MKIPFKAKALPAILSGLLAAGAVWADDTELPDSEITEAASGVPGDRIAGYFADFLGGESESQFLVEGLRNGTVHYQGPVDDPGSSEIENPETPESEGGAGMGYGNALITLALAERLALASAEGAPEGDPGMTADESLNEILRLRQAEGMGWGRIAKELNVNLGEVISGIRSSRPEKVEQMKAERPVKGGRAEKAEKVAKAERVARAERPEKVERVKLERPDRPARPEHPVKPERPGR